MEPQEVSADESKKKNLFNLPTELVDRIVDFLPKDRKDIVSLRLTCRELYVKTYAAFGAAAVGKIKSDLSPDSIERLRALAENGPLSDCVKEFIIDIPCDPADLKAWMAGLPHPVESQAGIKTQAPILRELCALFKTRFTNCGALRVDSGHCRNDSSDELHPWTTADAFDKILVPFAETTKIPVRGFNLIGSGNLAENRLGPPSAWLQSIKKLGVLLLFVQEDHAEPCISTLRRLLRGSISLENLYLEFDLDLRGLDNKVRLDGLFCHAICEGLVYSHVRNLFMHHLDVSEQSMTHILRHLRTSLDTLTLDAVFLMKGGTWGHIFEAVKDELTALRSITIHNLYEDDVLCFCKVRNSPRLFDLHSGKLELVETEIIDDGFCIEGVRYEGPCMSVALGIIACCHCIYVHERHGPDRSDRSEDAPKLERFDVNELDFWYWVEGKVNENDHRLHL